MLATTAPESLPAAVPAGHHGVASRFPVLDCLRAVAVLLVIWRHIPIAARPGGLSSFVSRGGVVGVDLFFVLSGFLIGSLLFREYQRRGAISVGYFYLRRGLKIYPAFYVFLLATLVYSWWHGPRVTPSAILSEALFIRNYTQFAGAWIWGHTWSLCVEEHFYILLPLVLVAIAKRGRTPFSRLPVVVAVVAVTCLVLRARSEAHGAEWLWLWIPSHMRVDSLMVGVLLAYWYCFHRARYLRVITRLGPGLAWVGALLLLPIFIFDTPETRWVMVWGFSLFALGSACLVSWAVKFTDANRASSLLAWIGTYSYSIYLWHFAVLHWFILPVVGPYGALHPWFFTITYVTACLTTGIVMARVIEYPVLHLRDRLFPSRSGSIAAPQHGTDYQLAIR